MSELSSLSESDDDTAFVSFHKKSEQAGLATPRRRCSSLPPLSGPRMSSPVINKNPEERKARRIRKGFKARGIMIAKKQQLQNEARVAR